MTTLTATGQMLAGRYTLNRWVAGGSMGEVWEATDARMDLTVAVKVLRPAHVNDPVALERFQIEAKIGAKLDHPGIAKVRDVNVDNRGGEPPWMVQEFVAGEPLTDVLARSGPLEPARAASIVAQAADAASAAHAVGIVHRDLTPRNLLLTSDDVVKVTDFGIARSDSVAALTMAGHVIGTPAYLSPEQVRGAAATAASDVYTLAVVLYECLAGIRPFDGQTPVDVARAHLDQVPPPLPNSVPGQLRATVLAALAKEPASRPSAVEFARRLLALANSRAPATKQRTPVRVHPVVTDQPTRPLTVAAAHGDRPGRMHGLTTALSGVVQPATRLWARSAPELQQVRQRLTAAWVELRQAWHQQRPDLARLARTTWSQLRVMRIGLAGAAALLLAVIAVLSSGNG